MANDVYLKEAFKSLRLLEADDEDAVEIETKDDDNKFNLADDKAFDNIGEFMDDGEEEDEEEVDIADLDAEEEEDLQDSYIGNVILECNVCHSLIYKKPEDITQCDDEDSVCCDEECPYCMGMDGFKIIGQVADYDPDATFDDEDTEIDSVEDDLGDEEGGEEFDDLEEPDVEGEEDEDDFEDMEESLNEELRSANIETDTDSFTVSTDESGSVTVTANPKDAGAGMGGEMIAPVDDTMMGNIDTGIEDNNEEDDNLNPPDMGGEEELGGAELTPDEGDLGIEGEEAPAEEGEDVDIEDFDEDEFDNGFGESLKSRYNNVSSYMTESIKNVGGKLFIEGIITFKSGSKKRTNFELRPKTITNEGVVKFFARNKELKETYVLLGKVKSKKLITESINVIRKKGAK